ncbi:MAG: hypothetical protein WD424_11435 [Paenibacillaceae bacterium]
MRIKKNKINSVMVFILLLLLTACSSGGNTTWDPAEVDAILSAEPSSIKAGVEVKLIAQMMGIPDKKGADMQFDIIIDGKSNLSGSHEEGEGVYSLLFVFPHPGTYDVYLHYYLDGEHITKLKRMEVI